MSDGWVRDSPTGEGGTRWTGPNHGKVWGRRDSRAEALTWGEVGAFVEPGPR